MHGQRRRAPLGGFHPRSPSGSPALPGRAHRGPGRGLGRRSPRVPTPSSLRRPVPARRWRPSSSPSTVATGPSSSGEGTPRDRRRLRLAASGAHRRREREPAQAPRRDRRGRQRARPRTALGAGRRAQRRHAAVGALGHVAQPARDRRHDARVALPAAHLGPGPGDALGRADGDRRRDPRPGPGQARLAPRPQPRAPRPPRLLHCGRDRCQPPGPHRAVGDPAPDLDHRPAPRRRGG